MKVPEEKNQVQSWRDLKKGFSKRLTLALAINGMNQSDLAKQLGVSRATVSRWFTDQPNLSSQKIATLTNLLKVSANWLILGCYDPEPPVSFEASATEKKLLQLLGLVDHAARNSFFEFVEAMNAARTRVTAEKTQYVSALIHDQGLPVVVTSKAGTICHTNTYFENFFGKKDGERDFIGKPVFEFITDFGVPCICSDKGVSRLCGHPRNQLLTAKHRRNGETLKFYLHTTFSVTSNTDDIFGVIFPAERANVIA